MITSAIDLLEVNLSFQKRCKNQAYPNSDTAIQIHFIHLYSGSMNSSIVV